MRVYCNHAYIAHLYSSSELPSWVLLLSKIPAQNQDWLKKVLFLAFPWPFILVAPLNDRFLNLLVRHSYQKCTIGAHVDDSLYCYRN